MLLGSLLQHLCELYNAAIQERRDAWKVCQKSITYYDQQKELTELRSVDLESKLFPVAVQRDPLRRVDRAFKSFFRRLKAKQEMAGYPRFKSRDRYDSFEVSAGKFRLEGNQVIVSKLGGFRFKTRCRIKGLAKVLHVKRCGGKWTASIICDIGQALEKKAVTKAIGIDLGLSSLVTLSNGIEIPNPRWTKREGDGLAAANRNLARKKRGSKNRLKSREGLRRVYQRIQGLRRSYLHGVSRELIGSYDLIAYEDLKIREMVQSTFSKSIMDAAWAELIWQLTYKAEEAGKWVVPVNPKNTTQICSGCGNLVPKTIQDRWHRCDKCGLSLSRDHNAAINILRLGESLAVTNAEYSK